MGSLFKLRDYWSASLREESSHDGAFVLSNIDNAPDGKLKIVFGTFQGVLRVIQPVGKGELSAEDVILEKTFSEPILQVVAGHFVPSYTNSLVLLFPKRVLFATLMRAETPGNGESAMADAPAEDASGVDCQNGTDCGSPEMGSEGMKSAEKGPTARQRLPPVRPQAEVFLNLRVVKEYQLDRALYNCVHGCFGACSLDILCVQSLDGQLSFMDYNKIICQCFIPEDQFLVPGFLAYCNARDLIVTNNSAMELLAYRYSAITRSFGSETNLMADQQSCCGDERTWVASGGKGRRVGSTQNVRLEPAWSFSIGEDVTGMCLSRLISRGDSEPLDLVVLCEHTLYVLTQDGNLIFNKRLDVPSTCLATYPTLGISGKRRSDNILIGTTTGSINVYNEMSMQWSAKRVAGAAMTLAVGSICGIDGFIVCLSFDGTLSVNYLGTDPASEPVQPLESQEVDYQASEKEYKQLQQTIRRAEESGSLGDGGAGSNGTRMKGAAGALPCAGADGEGVLGIQCSPPMLFSSKGIDKEESSSTEKCAERKATFQVRLVRLTAENDGSGTVTNVSMTVSVKPPLVANPSYVMIAEHLNEIQKSVQITVTAQPPADFAIPTSLEAIVVVTYTMEPSNQVRVAHTTTLLPFALVAKPVPPVRHSDFVVQINVNQDAPPSLAVDVFPDLAAIGEVAPNVLSVAYINGAEATVIVSKNGARFRLQASSLEALWLLSSELIRRLRVLYNVKSDSDHSMFDVADSVCVDAYLGVIDMHSQVRNELAEAEERLSEVAQAFRTVQKRLLFRLKDINPSPLDNLKVLFDDVYRSLQLQMERVEYSSTRFRQACAMLCACTSLISLLLEIKCQRTLRDGQERALVRSILSPEVPITTNAGWEEFTEAALMQAQPVTLGRQATATARAIAHSTAMATAAANRQSISSTIELLAVKRDTTALREQLSSFFKRLLAGERIEAV